MNSKQVVNHYRTQQAVADAIGVTQPCVANWIRRGRVPFLQQIRLEAASGGALRASAAARKFFDSVWGRESK